MGVNSFPTEYDFWVVVAFVNCQSFSIIFLKSGDNFWTGANLQIIEWKLDKFLNSVEVLRQPYFQSDTESSWLRSQSTLFQNPHQEEYMN